jgi:hypothetical protein
MVVLALVDLRDYLCALRRQHRTHLRSGTPLPGAGPRAPRNLSRSNSASRKDATPCAVRFARNGALLMSSAHGIAGLEARGCLANEAVKAHDEELMHLRVNSID